MIEHGAALLEVSGELLADVILACKLSQIGQRTQRLNSKAGLVVLILDRKQRSAFDPAVANAHILCQAVRIVGRAQKLISTPQVVPLLAGESRVATLDRIVVDRNDEQGCCIG